MAKVVNFTTLGSLTLSEVSNLGFPGTWQSIGTNVYQFFGIQELRHTGAAYDNTYYTTNGYSFRIQAPAGSEPALTVTDNNGNVVYEKGNAIELVGNSTFSFCSWVYHENNYGTEYTGNNAGYESNIPSPPSVGDYFRYTAEEYTWLKNIVEDTDTPIDVGSSLSTRGAYGVYLTQGARVNIPIIDFTTGLVPKGTLLTIIDCKSRVESANVPFNGAGIEFENGSKLVLHENYIEIDPRENSQYEAVQFTGLGTGSLTANPSGLFFYAKKTASGTGIDIFLGTDDTAEFVDLCPITTTYVYDGVLSGNITYDTTITNISSTISTAEATAYNIIFERAATQAPNYTDTDSTTDPEGNIVQPSGGNTTESPSVVAQNETEEIDIPNLPTSDDSTGLYTVYIPTAGQLEDFASYLFSDAFSVDSVKKLFANPMDYIIGLGAIPCEATVSGTQAVKIGTVSTTNMNYTIVENVTVDCGSVTIPEMYKSFLDYSPNTVIDLFLPYIGNVTLNPDEIMGQTVSVEYHVNIISGSCVAIVSNTKNGVIDQYTGNVMKQIPFSANNWGSLYSAVGGVAASLLAPAVTPLVMASTLGNLANSAKADIQKGNGVNGCSGWLGSQKPILYIKSPKISLAYNYAEELGYPSNLSTNLGKVSGFTVCESIHLHNCPGTDSEKDEIERLCKAGVIV